MQKIAKVTRMLAVCFVALALTGCAADQETQTAGEPLVYASMASSRAVLDAKTAASMISGYRRNNGLGAVTLDKELMRLAQEQARAMASRNELGHNVGGSFADRIRHSSIRARTVVENIAAGHDTLAEVFAGWRESPGHRANMLSPDATRMGIAAIYAPGSKYKVFWTLILASPNEGQNDQQNPGFWPSWVRP
jgi:uncharacterized protein YkwD